MKLQSKQRHLEEYSLYLPHDPCAWERIRMTGRDNNDTRWLKRLKNKEREERKNKNKTKNLQRVENSGVLAKSLTKD